RGAADHQSAAPQRPGRFRRQVLRRAQLRADSARPRPAGPPLLLAGKGPRMLRLVARYADAWNTAWYASPTTAQESIDEMQAACEAEGRDPATLELTISVPVSFPDLGTGSARGDSLSGPPHKIAATLRGFEALGA